MYCSAAATDSIRSSWVITVAMFALSEVPGMFCLRMLVVVRAHHDAVGVGNCHGREQEREVDQGLEEQRLHIL